MNYVSAYVLRHCDESPDRVAIDLGHAAVTFAELGGMVAGMANRLREEGLVKGELVMLTAENELHLMVSVLAVSAVGGVCMVIRRMLPATAVDKYALQFRPRLMVTDHHRFSLQGVQTIFLAARDFGLAGSNPTHFGRWAAERVISPKSDPFGLVVGSGSTGLTKVIQVTHGQKLAQLQTRARAFSFSASDRVASLTHVEFQAARRHLFSALSAGSTVMLYPKGGETEVLNMLRSNVTVLNVPGIVLHRLVSRFADEKGLLSDLRIMNTAGSLTSDELRHQIDRHITPHLHVVYATNELGFLTMATPDDWRTHPGSVGRLVEGVEMEIVDAHGMPVADGQPGLLRFRKPEMMTEYLDAPDLTRRSFRNGWF
jgi:acyl-coenzyme A synthetase/AMP-(fatty) acid ligase